MTAKLSHQDNENERTVGRSVGCRIFDFVNRRLVAAPPNDVLQKRPTAGIFLEVPHDGDAITTGS